MGTNYAVGCRRRRTLMGRLLVGAAAVVLLAPTNAISATTTVHHCLPRGGDHACFTATTTTNGSDATAPAPPTVAILYTGRWWGSNSNAAIEHHMKSLIIPNRAEVFILATPTDVCRGDGNIDTTSRAGGEQGGQFDQEASGAAFLQEATRLFEASARAHGVTLRLTAAWAPGADAAGGNVSSVSAEAAIRSELLAAGARAEECRVMNGLLWRRQYAKVHSCSKKILYSTLRCATGTPWSKQT